SRGVMRLLRQNPVSRRWRRLDLSVQRRLSIALPYALGGVAVLVATYLLADPAVWRDWLPFVILFVIIEMFTVEVNDRLFYSSSVMVVMTAGVVTAIQPGSDAVFAMALMAGLGAFTPVDFREKRWFQPMANFGQLVLSGAIAGAILDLGLGDLAGPDGSYDRSILLRVAIFAGLAALTYVTINNILVRKAVKTVYGNDNRQPWSQMHVLISGQMLMGLVGGLIGAAYLIANRPSAVLVLMVGVYAIGHMSLYAFSQLRQSHQSAIRGFVKTLEAKDMY